MAFWFNFEVACAWASTKLKITKNLSTINKKITWKMQVQNLNAYIEVKTINTERVININ